MRIIRLRLLTFPRKERCFGFTGGLERASEMVTHALSNLRCPRCRGALSEAADSCHDCGAIYGTVNGQPLLIDFEKSIFKPENYETREATVIPRLQRGTSLGRFLRKLTYGENPASRQNVFKFLREAQGLSKGPAILVIGGGSVGAGMDYLYSDEAEITLVGTDVYPSPNIHIICDGHQLPFADGTFHGVVVQAVMEHVLDPTKVAEEIWRVLVPGGVIYAETPFIQQVHEQGYDFTRFTLSGHRWLFRGFREIEAGTSLGPSVALLWSIAYFLKAIGLSKQVSALVTACFFWVRLLGRRADAGSSADGASGLYFIGYNERCP